MLGGVEPVLQVFMCLRHVAIRRPLPASPSKDLAHKNWLEWGELQESSSSAITTDHDSIEQMPSRTPTAPAPETASDPSDDMPTRRTKYAVRMYMCLPLPVKKRATEEEISPHPESPGTASAQQTPLPGAHHQLVVDVSCGRLSARIDDEFLKRLRELAHSVNSFRAERGSGVASPEATDTNTVTDVPTKVYRENI